jgi:hypothetical protein
MPKLDPGHAEAIRNSGPPDRWLRALADRARSPNPPTDSEIAEALWRLVGTHLRPAYELTDEQAAHDELLEWRRESGQRRAWPLVRTHGERDWCVFVCERCSLVCKSGRAAATKTGGRRCPGCGSDKLASGWWWPPKAWVCRVCGGPAYGDAQTRGRREQRLETCEKCKRAEKAREQSERRARWRAAREDADP